MTIVAVLPELTPEGAERLSERISGRLETIATNYVAVMPLIREAINRNAHEVLGYPSPGAYIKDRFGDSLSKLGAELRREVVKELSHAGLSTRAIAPVVGVNNATVHRDLSRVADATPAEMSTTVDTPDVPDLVVDESTGEVYGAGDGDDSLPPVAADSPSAPRPVLGLDGKLYSQPPRVPKPVLAGDALAKRDAQENAKAVGEALGTLEGFTFPAHRERVRSVWWPKGNDAVTPHNRDLYDPSIIRDLASALAAFADELEASL